MRPRALVVLALLTFSVSVTRVAADQTPTATYRVFLKNGQALPSYGESATVGNRVVFNLVLDAGSSAPTLTLMSLPVAAVDMDRTARYAAAMRSAYFAATRGEAAYQALSTTVTNTLSSLSTIADRARQLAVAQGLRQQIIDWSEANFSYRDDDVGRLQDKVEDEIADLRASAGASEFSLDLVAKVAPVPPERLLPAAGAREALTAALSAAAADDNVDERMTVLSAATAVASKDLSLDDIAEIAKLRLADERRTSQAYVGLATRVRQAADLAARRGDVSAFPALEASLAAEDRALGSSRPDEMRTLAADVEAALASARAYRTTLDRYVVARPGLLLYERQVRATFIAMSGLSGLLGAIRDLGPVRIEAVAAADTRLGRLQADLNRLDPPPALLGVHATIASAVAMAREACRRRQRTALTNVAATAREASAAAAGALLLRDRARADLVAALHPPPFP